MNDRKLMQVALHALEEITGWQSLAPGYVMEEADEAKNSMRDRLAQPEMIPITNGGVATLMPSSEFFGGQLEPELVTNASTWWAMVMGAAASIEDASNFLQDEAAKQQAIGAAKHYRDSANTFYRTRNAPPQDF